MLETREVLALGATSPRKVQLRICAATHKELRVAVNEGKFRADLYYRIGRPEVRMPALHERLDEIPWFLQRAFAAVDPQLTASIATLETCALRRWPGNVRELLLEAKHAAHAALAEGAAAVRPDHFAPSAGLALGDISSSYPAAALSSRPPADPTRSASALDDAAIEAALAEAGGNVSRAAQALGLHRNQLRRWMAKREGK